jgi:hypothetical protein
MYINVCAFTIINKARKTTRREETTKIHKWICYVKKRELRFELIYTYLLPVIALSFGLYRLVSFLYTHPGDLRLMDIISDMVMINPSSIGYILYTRVMITLANISGSMIFLGAVISRIRNERLKTLAYGAFALLILFATNIYGIFTFWKGGNKWLTR